MSLRAVGIQEYVLNYVRESDLNEMILVTCDPAENKLPKESEL